MRTLGTPLLEWAGACPPAAKRLKGQSVLLEPLDANHADDLFRSARANELGDALWDYLPYGPFADVEAYRQWIAHDRPREPTFFAVLTPDGIARGVVSFMRAKPEMGSIEIGHIWLGHELRQTPMATEAFYLMLGAAFDAWSYRRVEWKCDALNDPSRAAALRLGFEFEGVFRQHMVIKARNRDTAWYALLDRDWPLARAALAAWLAPENYDDEGRQRSSLGTLRDRGLSDQGWAVRLAGGA